MFILFSRFSHSYEYFWEKQVQAKLEFRLCHVSSAAHVKVAESLFRLDVSELHNYLICEMLSELCYLCLTESLIFKTQMMTLEVACRSIFEATLILSVLLFFVVHPYTLLQCHELLS